MKKTFEEIINEEFNSEENYLLLSGETHYLGLWALKLMQLVRIKTLEEAVSKAEVNYTIIKDKWDSDDVEVYVINSSILNLDKNSIEI